MRIKNSAEASFLGPRRGDEGWRGGLKKNRIEPDQLFQLLSTYIPDS